MAAVSNQQPPQRGHLQLIEQFRTIETAMKNTWEVLSGRSADVADSKKRLAWRQVLNKMLNAYDFPIFYLNVNRVLLPRLVEELLQRDREEIRRVAAGNESYLLFEKVTDLYARYRLLMSFADVIFSSLNIAIFTNGVRRQVPLSNEAEQRRALDAERAHMGAQLNCFTSSEIMIHVFQELFYHRIKKELMEGAIRVVNSGRENNEMNMSRLQTAVAIFHDTGKVMLATGAKGCDSYKADFEDEYIEQSINFYDKAAASYLAVDGNHQLFLEWCSSKFDFEAQLCHTLMPARDSSHLRVKQAMVNALLTPRVQMVVNHETFGLYNILKDILADCESKKMESAMTMWKMMQLVPADAGVKAMAKDFSRFFADELMEKCTDMFPSIPADRNSSIGNERVVLDNMIDLHNKAENIMKTLNVMSRTEFQSALKSAINVTINREFVRQLTIQGKTVIRESNGPELLANYCDAVLKKEFKDFSDPADEEAVLQKLADLFSHLEEKDRFKNCHQKHLALRLIRGTYDKEKEENFLRKLNKYEGSDFTRHLEGMFRDKDRSKILSEEFQNHAISKTLDIVGFNVEVLAQGHWPRYTPDGLVPCAGLRKCLDAFTDFYKERHSSHILTWIHWQGSAKMIIRPSKGGKYEVSSNLYQAVILSLVYEHGPMSVAEIADAMQLDAASIVNPQLATMYLSKNIPPILAEVDENGEVLDTERRMKGDERVAPNENFKFNKGKFKLVVPSSKASEKMVTDQELQARRNDRIDACIVRVMKSSRILKHRELLELCIAQLSKSFRPQPKTIKTRIDDLITREYLKRQENNTDTYEYLA